jgi:HEAT repeat protein
MTPTRDELVALTVDPGSFLDSKDPVLRRLAVTSIDPTTDQDLCGSITRLVTDPSAPVRAAVAEKLGTCGNSGMAALTRLREDDEPTVREAVATAYAEIGDASHLEWLVERVRSDDDRQVKEAAVAALGAIGDAAAIDPLIEFVRSGPPQVRRRAIAAITVFDDDRIEPVLVRAAMDRNPGVREAAEMVVGRQITEA